MTQINILDKKSMLFQLVLFYYNKLVCDIDFMLNISLK